MTAERKTTGAYLSVASAYFLTVGVLYLWGYWARFDVNILEYLGLTDVVKLTAYPIASAFIFLVAGAVMGELTVASNQLPPGGGRDTTLGRFLNKHKSWVLSIYVVGTAALFMFGSEEKWRLLPILVSWPIYFAAKEVGFLEELGLHESARSIAIFMLSVLPLWAYGHGRLDATDILAGTKYKYLAASVPGVDVKDLTKEAERYKYLGHAGGFIFLLAPNNETIVVNFENVDALRLRSNAPQTSGL